MDLFGRQLSASQQEILKILRKGTDGNYGSASLVTVFNQIQKAFPEKIPVEILGIVYIDVTRLYEIGLISIAQRGWKWLPPGGDVKALEIYALANIRNFVEWNEIENIWQESKKIHSITSLFLKRMF